MRLAPPVPGLLPREVLPGGITIDGQFFEAGTVVGTPCYALHHREEYFRDAWAYRPGRWIVRDRDAKSGGDLGEGTTESVSLAHSAFCPFSVGPRGCIGKGMAYLEVSVALARMVWLYDVRLAASDGDGEAERKFQPMGVTSGWAKGLGKGGLDAEWGKQARDEYEIFDAFVAVKDGPVVQFRRRDGL